MARDERERGVRQVTTGLLLMAAGALLLLDQRGLIDVGPIGRWWAAVLVLMGLWKITAPRAERDAGGGAMLIVFGVWILACTHHWMGLTFRNSWPLVFVAIGVKMMVRALLPPGPGSRRAAARYRRIHASEDEPEGVAGKEPGDA